MAKKKHDEFTDSGIINCDDLNKARHVIIGLNYDVTSSGLKGADKGPAAIVKALREQIEPYNPMLGCSPCESVKIAQMSCTLNDLSPEEMVKFVEKVCTDIFRYKKNLTIVGGEHSVIIPALKAYANVHDAKEITILYIDAHLDLRDTDEFRVKPYGKYAHCCVMRRAHEFGFRHFVQIGARSYSKEELDYANVINTTGGGTFALAKYEPFIDTDDIMRDIVTDKVWVSLDVDGICPGDMPATGTPVGGGPSFSSIRNLLFQLACSKQIVDADVVEVAPDLGLTNLTAYNAAQLAYDLICYRVIKK